MEKQHAAAVINGHGAINKEEGKHGDAYKRTTTNGCFGVLCRRGWYTYIGRKTPHIHIN